MSGEEEPEGVEVLIPRGCRPVGCQPAGATGLGLDGRSSAHQAQHSVVSSQVALAPRRLRGPHISRALTMALRWVAAAAEQSGPP